jgi:hypothetical protein
LRLLSSSPISIRRRSAPTMAMTLKKRYLILVLISSVYNSAEREDTPPKSANE